MNGKIAFDEKSLQLTVICRSDDVEKPRVPEISLN